MKIKKFLIFLRERENKGEKRCLPVDEWACIAQYQFSGLNEQEKAQFEKAQRLEEKATITHFTLGEPIPDR
jgi:hypothetical protein